MGWQRVKIRKKICSRQISLNGTDKSKSRQDCSNLHSKNKTLEILKRIDKKPYNAGTQCHMTNRQNKGKTTRRRGSNEEQVRPQTTNKFK